VVSFKQLPKLKKETSNEQECNLPDRCYFIYRCSRQLLRNCQLHEEKPYRMPLYQVFYGLLKPAGNRTALLGRGPRRRVLITAESVTTIFRHGATFAISSMAKNRTFAAKYQEPT